MPTLTLNSGSSSLKFALYRDVGPVIKGAYSCLGEEGCCFEASGKRLERGFASHKEAAEHLIGWLEEEGVSFDLAAHRIVHGGPRAEEAVKVDRQLLAKLKELKSLAPEHLPQQIELLELFQEKRPDLLQVACFDTAFHRARPERRKRYALPLRFAEEGVLRYGFHGLAYESLLKRLEELEPELAQGKVIACHLGSGASVTAIEGGLSQETSMGFTPVSGLIMSSRTGELDPGVILYLIEEKQLHPREIRDLIYRRSGLLALSELSADMRDLLREEGRSRLAKEAIESFCESAVKEIGAFALLLEGVEALIFSGGIGENSPSIRARICRRLGLLGVSLDPEKNSKGAVEISGPESRVKVYVLKADEEAMLAKHAKEVTRDA